MTRHVNKIDWPSIIARYCIPANFRIEGADYEWMVAPKSEPDCCKYNCGAILGVRSLENSFDIEVPIHCHEYASVDPIYLNQGDKYALIDLWFMTEVVVYGSCYPLIGDVKLPVCGELPRFYRGDPNIIPQTTVIALTQSVLFPKKRAKFKKYRAVKWKSQCWKG